MTIAVEHPAVWIEGGDQIVRDLIEVFTHSKISPDCLQHLIANRHRLVGGQYELIDGRGCLMFVLTEPLASLQIRSKEDLSRFFGRERGQSPGNESPEYQPAKWLVRLVDNQICERVRARYGRSCEFFDYDLVVMVAKEILEQLRADSEINGLSKFALG
jgi:hypothetical protein